MEHYKKNQYDDDLTQGRYDDDLTSGITDYDENFDSGDVDLFDYVDDEDSPLARLKSIILSIEWEITNTILRQFNDELQDLKGVWAGNKVNLVYIQALEKIGKYIYKEKASAHPNAIKLLLTFYTNLEKINSDDAIPAVEQKKILRQDIERFEKLKKQIASASTQSAGAARGVEGDAAVPFSSPDRVTSPAREPAMADFQQEADEQPDVDSLLNLKALVYGIDWEITEYDLKSLSREVKGLEQKFGGSKAKRIFLQGIGSLGAYINLKRGDSHPDAFKLLHSLFMGLERVVRDNLSGRAEKDVLLPEVEKFEVFKAAIAQSGPSQPIAKIAKAANVVEDHIEEGDEEEIRPAFADMPEDSHGFQEEKAAAELQQRGADTFEEADEYIEEDETAQSRTEDDDILADEMESKLDGMFDEPELEAARELDQDMALRGVDVETEDDDDSEEEPLPEYAGEPAPALADGVDLADEKAPAVLADTDDVLFEEAVELEGDSPGREFPGIDVEHDADDDSDEEPLPFDGDEIAPALAAEDDDTPADRKEDTTDLDPDIDSTVEQFFADSFDKEQAGPVDDDMVAAEEAEELLAERNEEPAAEAEEEAAETPVDEVEGEIAPSFEETHPEIDAIAMEDAAEGVEGVEEVKDVEGAPGAEVEIAEDDDSEEEPPPHEEGEVAPALSAETGEQAKALEDEVDQEADGRRYPTEIGGIEAREDLFEEVGEEQEDSCDVEEVYNEESETLEADDGFDALFEDEEDEAREPDDTSAKPLISEEESAAPAAVDQDDVSRAAVMPPGVDVEWEEDDDIEEEPLPEEDGELVPALAMDKDDHDRLPVEEHDEQEVGDRFDALFGTEENDLQSEEEELVEDAREKSVVEAFRPEKSEKGRFVFDDEAVADEKDRDAEQEADDFDAAGFEEIEEIEEIWDDGGGVIPEPADVVEEPGHEAAPGSEEADIKALFDEAAQDEHPSARADEIAFASEDYEEDGWSGEDIPELDAEGFATVIEDDSVPYDKTPEGYQPADALLRRFAEEGAAKEGAEQEGAEQEAPSSSMHPEDNEDYIIGIAAAGEEEEVIFEAAENDQDQDQGQDQALLQLADLRNCIASIGLEIDDAILVGVHEEIEKLRHVWKDKPAEKTFVELLSTIANHIEKYRYDADQESNRLLLSVFEKLEFTVMEGADSAEVQEALLGETSRVLQWQAGLIDRMVPFEPLETTSSALLGEKGADGEFDSSLDGLSQQVDANGDDMLMEKVSTIMKSELEQLKTVFHLELRELREEIMRGKDKE
ncbi:MAG: hypothetical protein ABR512_06645 [Desulfopila sp.]